MTPREGWLPPAVVRVVRSPRRLVIWVSGALALGLLVYVVRQRPSRAVDEPCEFVSTVEGMLAGKT